MTTTTASAPGAYEGFAEVYDAFTAGSDYENWTGHVLRLAGEHGLRGRRLLDVACGTGKSFLPFVARGFDVTGCDVSPAMLAEARREGTRCDAGRGGHARSLPTLGEFDLVTCFDDSLNHLLDEGRAGRGARGRSSAQLGPGRAAAVRPQHPARLPHDVRRGRRGLRAKDSTCSPAAATSTRTRRRAAWRPRSRSTPSPKLPDGRFDRGSPTPARAALPAPQVVAALLADAGTRVRRLTRRARRRHARCRRSTRRASSSSSTPRDSRKEVSANEHQEDQGAGPAGPVLHEDLVVPGRSGPAPQPGRAAARERRRAGAQAAPEADGGHGRVGRR